MQPFLGMGVIVKGQGVARVKHEIAEACRFTAVLAPMIWILVEALVGNSLFIS
jgi:hypothetical protein